MKSKNVYYLRSNYMENNNRICEIIVQTKPEIPNKRKNKMKDKTKEKKNKNYGSIS